MELSTKFLSKPDTEKSKRLESMLNSIRSEINEYGSCMLLDEQNVLPLCVVPYYNDKLNEIDDMGEFSHKAPVLLDCFFENYSLQSWDLTTKKVFFLKSKLLFYKYMHMKARYIFSIIKFDYLTF